VSQASFDGDDLFDEATGEIQSDIQDELDALDEALPAPDEIWEVDADNILGTLNTLKSVADVEDATTHLREAKKQYMLGERADAFDGGNDLEDEIRQAEELVGSLQQLSEDVTELTATIPQLRSELQNLEAPTDDTVDGESDEENETNE
jgi:uncharacterized phage infection (PIP) family protein YhgE